MMHSNIVTIQPVGLPEDDFVGPEFSKFGGTTSKKTNMQKRPSAKQNQKKVACTVCLRQEYPNLRHHKQHPVLKVIVCKDCNNFYASGEFLKDDNGIDERCRWCGDGADVLAICDMCTNVFCKQCIEQNCTSETARRILKSTSFKCFVCDSAPILAKQLECQRIFAELRQRSKRAKSETKSRAKQPAEDKAVDHAGKSPANQNGVHTHASDAATPEPKRVPKLRIQINQDQNHEVMPQTQSTVTERSPSVSTDDDHVGDEVHLPVAPCTATNGGDSSPAHCSRDSIASSQQADQSAVSRMRAHDTSVSSWKGHCRRKMQRIQSEVAKLESQLSNHFGETSETPWSTFVALKAIQELKNDSSTLLGAIKSMHAEICRIEDAVTSRHRGSGDTSTTAKESDNESIDSSLSSPTKRKLLRKRKEREMLRRSKTLESSESYKPWYIVNDVETTRIISKDSDSGGNAEKNTSGASKSDIFQDKTATTESDELDLHEAPPSGHKQTASPRASNGPTHSPTKASTPDAASSRSKNDSKTAFSSSDSDVDAAIEGAKFLRPSRNAGIGENAEPRETEEVASTAGNTSKRVEESDDSSDEDADLFRPIVTTPTSRRDTPRGKGDETPRAGQVKSTVKKETLAKSSDDDEASPRKRQEKSKKRKLFVDSDESSAEENEVFDDDDDFVQTLPSGLSTGQLQSGDESDVDGNEVAFQHLLKNMMDESNEEASDADVDEVLQPKPSTSASLAHNAPSSGRDATPESDAEETPTLDQSRSDNDATHKKAPYKHPLLNVPISLSDGEMTRRTSARKRKTPAKRTGPNKKRRKLHMEEALKDFNLSTEDQAILRRKAMSSSHLNPTVVLRDIKDNESLRHHLVSETSSRSAEAQSAEESLSSQRSHRRRISSSSTEGKAQEESNDSESLLPPKQVTPKPADRRGGDSGSDDTILDRKSGDESAVDSDLELLGSDLLESSEPESKAGPSGARAEESTNDSSGNDFPVFSRNRIFAKKKRQSTMSDFIKQEASEDDFAAPSSSKAKKRRRIVVNDSSDDDDAASSIKKGRRNIRKIIDDDSLSQATQEAGRMESERMRRLERQDDDLEEEVIIVEDESSPMKKKITTTRLILSKDPLVEVDSNLVQKLKPHQVEGVKFMWKNVIETVAVANKRKGDGCILAHCMGLGKTFQVVTLLHTVLSTPFLPKLTTALVLCPLGIVINWSREFAMWTRDCRRRVRTYDLSAKSNYERCIEVKKWQRLGGVMIVSYGLFKTLCQGRGKGAARFRDSFTEGLLKPGADLIVCDEGHVIKNSVTNLSSLVAKVQTHRRIVLTGTPLQNNLMEYHCMVSFIKPRLLGNAREFANRFANPIANGQHVDSTEYDVKLMKKRSHILHKLLAGFVQRKDVGCLRQLLQPKFEYVLSVRLSELQVRLYKAYLQRCSGDLSYKMKCLFMDFNNLLMIVCHPRVLHLAKSRREKKEDQESLKRMINDDSEDEDDEEDDDEAKENRTGDEKAQEKDPDVDKLPTMSIQDLKKLINAKGGDLRGAREKTDLVDIAKSLLKPQGAQPPPSCWFESVMPTQDQLYRAAEHSGKVVILLEILDHAASIGDKVVVFSQSLLALDFIEEVLRELTRKREKREVKRPSCALWRWYRNVDYYRIDGSTNAGQRKKYIEQFNDRADARGRLFLISTKAGGIGVNLVGANRAVVFDACWNPTHDLQSIFRIYRFGQTKNCYVYRLIAQGTMEEKIYNRQVVKQSLAYRVIDEQQIERHFTADDISDLYDFNPDTLDDKSQDKLREKLPPKDSLLADLLEQANTRDAIVSYHEHESLLDHQVEEELSEAERKLAWDEYDSERRRRIAMRSALHHLGPVHLENLHKLAEAQLKENAALLAKIKDEELHVTMLKLKACDPEMDADRLQEAATRIHLKKMMIKDQLERTRGFIVNKAEQIRFCFHQRAPYHPPPQPRPPSGPAHQVPSRPAAPSTTAPDSHQTDRGRPHFATTSNPTSNARPNGAANFNPYAGRGAPQPRGHFSARGTWTHNNYRMPSSAPGPSAAPPPPRAPNGQRPQASHHHHRQQDWTRYRQPRAPYL